MMIDSFLKEFGFGQAISAAIQGQSVIDDEVISNISNEILKRKKKKKIGSKLGP